MRNDSCESTRLKLRTTRPGCGTSPRCWTRHGTAARQLQPIYERGNLFGLAAFLRYPQFDPAPFPDLMAVLVREGIDRPDPVRPPFACELESEEQNSVAVLPFVALSSSPSPLRGEALG